MIDMELDRLNQVIVQMFRRSIGEELLVGCEVIWQPGAGEIVIICSSKQQTRELAKYSVKLVWPIQGYARKIRIIGETANYLFSPHVVTQLEPKLMLIEEITARAQRHHPLLNSIAPGAASVSLHSQSEPFEFLNITAIHPARLNKPSEILIGASPQALSPELADPRIHYLKRAVETGSHQRYEYTYDWEGLHWKFEVSIAPLWGSEELIAIVRDKEPWQLGYWLNRVD